MIPKEIMPVFATFIFFGSITLILWKYFEGNHKVKMALIEKGLKPEENPLSVKSIPSGMNILRSLQFGLLILFVGLGTLLGSIINNMYFWDMVEQFKNSQMNMNAFHRYDSIQGGTMFACITIFGGIGLVLFYFIARKKMKEDNKKA